MTAQRGFTLIELLVVMTILGILSGLSLLKLRDLRYAAVAAQMTQELRAVQVAAFNYFADHETWPLETGPGAVPAGLAPLLPAQLTSSFDRGEYVLDYENFGGTGEVVIGVSVTSSNERLFAKFAQFLGKGSPFFIAGNTITYLISGPGGIF
ncbi:MAG: type II secretion system protein [Gemmatimonadales bacterium]|nr:type II secretion system protein [Gemmatimonadales bacterium]